MARNSVDDWSATPDDNTDIGGTNIAEGCPPGNMNNGLRKMMAQVRTWANSLKFVSYVAQALTNEQKQQARSNIGVPANYDDRYYTEGEVDLQRWLQSSRDFPSGTLIKTNIDANASSGEAFLIEVKGNGYNNSPVFLLAQGYLYNDQILVASAISAGRAFTGTMRVFNLDGFVTLWFPTQGYWEGFDVFASVVSGAAPVRKVNRVVSVTDAVLPGARTKDTVVTVAQAAFVGHTHDDRYYTETEVNNLLAGNMSGRAYPRRSDGTAINVVWSDPGGSPTWIMGTSNGLDFRPHSTANVSVGYASSAGNASTVGGSSLATINANIAARAPVDTNLGVGTWIQIASSSTTPGAVSSWSHIGLPGSWRAGLVGSSQLWQRIG